MFMISTLVLSSNYKVQCNDTNLCFAFFVGYLHVTTYKAQYPHQLPISQTSKYWMPPSTTLQVLSPSSFPISSTLSPSTSLTITFKVSSPQAIFSTPFPPPLSLTTPLSAALLSTAPALLSFPNPLFSTQIPPPIPLALVLCLQISVTRKSSSASLH